MQFRTSGIPKIEKRGPVSGGTQHLVHPVHENVVARVLANKAPMLTELHAFACVCTARSRWIAVDALFLECLWVLQAWSDYRIEYSGHIASIAGEGPRIQCARSPLL